MVRILAIGDFHGKLTVKLKKLIEKYEFDMIISQGDFCADRGRTIFFKKCYGKDLELWDVIGKKKYEKLTKQNEKDGETIISYLKKLGKPLFVVTGNHDHAGQKEIGYTKEVSSYVYPIPLTLNYLNKLKIPVLDFAKTNFAGFDLIGYPRSSYPGIPSKSWKAGKTMRINEEKIKKDYKVHKKKMSKFFKGAKNTIFISHNVPYMTKLDNISQKGHVLARNKHYGSYLVKQLIKKYQPRLVIAGHMHENPGKIRIGKTIVVNPGAAMDGRAALIELTDKHIRVRFINT